MKLTTIPPVQPEPVYLLELTAQEAADLLSICGGLAGGGSISSQIYHALKTHRLPKANYYLGGGGHQVTQARQDEKW